MLIVFFPRCPAWPPRRESQGKRVAAEQARLRSPCLQCCQLFLQNFSASHRGKMRPGDFHFLKEFGLTENTISVYVSGKIIFLGLS
jgi:hypothetical protein